jgi:TetR/AcrR family transcriptional repressor of nem operon
MGRKSDSRKRLLDAARELIWGLGYGTLTVETICLRARVRRGTFYHFFDSKSDLAECAVQTWWDERRPLVEQLFRPEIPPLERIGKFLDFVTRRQFEHYEKSGQILGCPLFTLGSEICTQDERLRLLVQKILGSVAQFFEEAIRDAQASGEVAGNNTTVKVRLLWAFYEGTLTRARIENNPELIRCLNADAIELIRIHPHSLQPVRHHQVLRVGAFS